jgi:hypothetical protein
MAIPRATLAAAWHTLGTFAGVMAATAVTLAALNTLPDWIANNPMRVRSASSIGAAEANLGRGLWLPAYYPQWLAWPPAGVRYVTGPPAIVGIELRTRDTHEPVMHYVQSSMATAPVPALLLPAAERSDESAERVSGRPATLATIRLADGSRWRELAWSDGDSRFVMRYRGHDPDVLRMARSLRKERP